MSKFDRSKLYFITISILLGFHTASAKAVLDFDGDGKTDPLVFAYDQTGQGYQQITWFMNNSRDGFSAVQFGMDQSGMEDRPVPADYDGDGKCDIAVWRRTFATAPNQLQSYFFILNSSTNTFSVIQWGLTNDYPVTQDYDGDGKADPAVYRPSESMWYIIQSRDGLRGEKWGPGTAITGDFDGDGKGDFATYSAGAATSNYPLTFKVKRSSDGSSFTDSFGSAMSDYAIPGDFDGDGKTDLAIWSGRTEYGNGYWTWHRSSDGQYDQKKWGYVEVDDYPVPGDYDGDGTTDIAVYHLPSQPGQAHFLINGSKNGYMDIAWGSTKHDALRMYR